jgi:purine-binding chemotaxis protein CheW
MKRPVRHKEDPSKNYVGCVVGDLRYAIPIPAVREIVNALALLELPNAPPSVLGVADYRSEVIPVVSLRAKFGLPPIVPTRRTKWIVVEAEGRLVALVVDAVTEVFRSATVRSAPSLGAGDETRGIEGVAEKEGALVFVLDISRLGSLIAPIDGAAVALLGGVR